MKAAPFLLSLLLLCCALTACQSEENETPRRAASMLSQSAPGNSFEDPVDESITFFSETPFTMISPPEYTSYGSGNSKGFYSIIPNADHSGNILYADYATGSQVYLCSRPNCEHNSDACTSWIPPFTGTIVPAATETQLFLICSGGNTRPEIKQLELNGDRPRTVFSLPNGAKLENAIAANDDTLVVSIQQYEQEGETVSQNSFLAAIDLFTGKASVLFSLNSQLSAPAAQTASLSFKGLTKNAFIVESVVQGDYRVDAKDMEQSFQNMNDALKHTVYMVPYDGSSAHPILSYSNGQCSGMPFDDCFFYVEKRPEGGISLKKTVPSTGKTQVLIDNFSDTILGEGANSLTVDDIVFRNFVNGKLLLNCMADAYIAENGDMEMVFSGLSVDSETGETNLLRLTNHYNATTVPVDILAVCGDRLLVFADITSRSAPGSDMLVLQRRLGLICAEDYLNSRPTYQMIDSVRPFQ